MFEWKARLAAVSVVTLAVAASGGLLDWISWTWRFG
jgi:hypothetical protein